MIIKIRQYMLFIIFFLINSCTIATYAIENVEKYQLHLQHSNLANQYYIIAQTAGLFPEFFIIPNYRKAWENFYGKNSHDEMAFHRIKEIYERLQPFLAKHFELLAFKSGLFAQDPNDFNDTLLNAFFMSSTFDEAIQKLSSELTEAEIKILRDNLPGLLQKTTALINVENTATELTLVQLNALLNNKNVDSHLTEIQKFYAANFRPFRSIQFVWDLNEKDSTTFGGFCIGDILILRIPSHFPINQDQKVLHMLVSILIHEATHHISGSIQNPKKLALSLNFFLHGGSIRNENPLFVLEEPLAVASQMYFLKHYDSEFYSENDDWFDPSPAPHNLLKLLEEYRGLGKSLDANLLKKYLRMKNDVLNNNADNLNSF